MSSILHLLPLIYPVFTCMDPYSEYRSESNLDPDQQHCYEVVREIFLEFREYFARLSIILREPAFLSGSASWLIPVSGNQMLCVNIIVID